MIRLIQKYILKKSYSNLNEFKLSYSNINDGFIDDYDCENNYEDISTVDNISDFYKLKANHRLNNMNFVTHENIQKYKTII